MSGHQVFRAIQDAGVEVGLVVAVFAGGVRVGVGLAVAPGSIAAVAVLSAMAGVAVVSDETAGVGTAARPRQPASRQQTRLAARMRVKPCQRTLGDI